MPSARQSSQVIELPIPVSQAALVVALQAGRSDARKVLFDRYSDDVERLLYRILGPDSEKALRAVYAAGLQGRLWEYLDLLYRSQGAENSGWVTDELLRSVGASIPGFDTDRMMAAMNSTEVSQGLAAADAQAQQAGVNSTPTLYVNGRALIGAMPFENFKQIIDEELSRK